MHHANGGLLIHFTAEGHGAETDARHRDPRPSQRAALHVLLPSNLIRPGKGFPEENCGVAVPPPVMPSSRVRIGGIPQSVAHEVEGQHGDHDDQPR